MMKKFITYVTAASLLMGSMCTTAYGATFADIDTVTWSGFKPFLEEAAELGLMSGYDENGKKYCKPRNNVTYCEAVQLMYSIMKVYTRQDVSSATVTKWKPVISAYDIDEWAFKSISYSLENGILTTTDLNKLSGNKAANREDVGVIFGKAIDTINGYDTKSNASLSYKDKAKVSAAAVPYLELLNRANLMVGDTDNNFNPKANISRAEMAVLSVKTYNKLTETGTGDTAQNETVAATVASSKIMANGDLFLSLTLNSGGGLSLFAAVDDVKPRYNGDKITFEDIAAGDTVKVAYEGTNITSLEVIYSKNGIRQTTQETFELKDITDKKVVVKDGSKEKDYRLSDDVDVELDGKNSTVKKLQSALENANYDVTLTLDADEYVLEVSAMLNDNNPTEGMVEDITSDSITIRAGSREYTYPLADDLVIEQDGKTVRFSKFEDDYEDYNYEVSLKLNDDNEVEEITIESMEDEYNGTLTYINSNRVEFSAGGDTYKYDFADDVTVKIDGKKSSVEALRDSFRNDGKAYTVSVDLDRDDEITELLATSKYTGNSDGKLDKIDAYEITVVVNGKDYIYDLASDVDVEINGKSRDVDDLKNYLGAYEFDVELGFDSKGDVIEIKATMKEASEGELRGIDNNVLTIRAADISMDLDLASNVDVTLDGDDVTLAELDDALWEAYGGSRIYVELEYNSSGKVNVITANWEDVFGELVSIDEDKEEITVKEDGGTEKYTLARDVEFVYRISYGVEEEDYRSRYNNDLDGLQDFLEDCDDANDDCMVVLTWDSDRDIVRVKATAQ